MPSVSHRRTLTPQVKLRYGYRAAAPPAIARSTPSSCSAGGQRAPSTTLGPRHSWIFFWRPSDGGPPPSAARRRCGGFVSRDMNVIFSPWRYALRIISSTIRVWVIVYESIIQKGSPWEPFQARLPSERRASPGVCLGWGQAGYVPARTGGGIQRGVAWP